MSHLKAGQSFAHHDVPKTQDAGWSGAACTHRIHVCRDTFDDGASNSITHSELAALFAVIGTPAWADVQCVHSSDSSCKNTCSKVSNACRDTYDDGASNPITHSEEAALFAVIGTPAWADVQCVHSQTSAPEHMECMRLDTQRLQGHL